MDSNLNPKQYLPDYYKGIREIDTLSEALCYVLTHVNGEFKQLLYNQFVQLANSDGLTRFEKMLGITTDLSEEMETRRQRILSKMAASTIFTERVLSNTLLEMCDNGEYVITHDYDHFYLDLKVRIGRKGMLDVLYDLLYTMLPAHVSFYIHNHLPASSSGGTTLAASTSIKHVYDVLDAVATNNSTSLTLSTGLTTSISFSKEILDSVVDTLNSSLSILPGASVSLGTVKSIVDSQDLKVSTKEDLTVAVVTTSAKIVKN